MSITKEECLSLLRDFRPPKSWRDFEAVPFPSLQPVLVEVNQDFYEDAFKTYRTLCLWCCCACFRYYCMMDSWQVNDAVFEFMKLQCKKLEMEFESEFGNEPLMPSPHNPLGISPTKTRHRHCPSRYPEPIQRMFNGFTYKPRFEYPIKQTSHTTVQQPRKERIIIEITL